MYVLDVLETIIALFYSILVVCSERNVISFMVQYNYESVITMVFPVSTLFTFSLCYIFLPSKLCSFVYQ